MKHNGEVGLDFTTTDGYRLVGCSWSHGGEELPERHSDGKGLGGEPERGWGDEGRGEERGRTGWEKQESNRKSWMPWKPREETVQGEGGTQGCRKAKEEEAQPVHWALDKKIIGDLGERRDTEVKGQVVDFRGFGRDGKVSWGYWGQMLALRWKMKNV